MAYEFKLPDLGEGITEAEVRKWLVKEGDEIAEHQNVLEVETDKAVVQVPSPRGGKVLKLNKEEGDTAKVGEPLMTIAEKGEEIEEKEEKPEPSVTVVGELPEAPEEAVLAAPAVRQLAKERGIDLKKIKGTGPGGTITRDDVLKKAEERPPEEREKDEYGPVERVPVRGLRKTIARNLMKSQKSTVSVTVMEEADFTELWDLREREKVPLAEKNIHLTFLPFIMKAVQHSLLSGFHLNSMLDEEHEEIVIKKYINLGIAVDTPEGLMVPVIKNVESKSIVALAQELQELSLRARDRKITLDEMKGSSFTISNYGSFGGTFATPLINYPDTAILGLGRITEKPWVRGGKIEIRKILPLSLTFDHRVTDGVEASKFLSRVMDYIQDPALIFVESA
jgi:pyruvate dehydrogenase E2 component (dihydrolipoamide acetyltransferase)